MDYGECGLPEQDDTSRVREREMAKLVKLVASASFLVIHTGAGVSTSCGIRDFRGPRGVWTRERQGLGLQLLPGDVPFDEASPSLTHMAILGLVRAGRCRFVVSQNVDGLHLRSGLPSDRLAELHGNIFQERCERCRRVWFRNFDVGGVGFKATPRACDDCGGQLFDLTLDWEDPLPERDLKLARKHALLADVSLALGTSMRVHPAATIPLLTVDKSQRLHQTLSNIDAEEPSFEGLVTSAEAKRLLARNGRLAVVNLQPTPHDKDSEVRLHVACDRVMLELMRRLALPVPDFSRIERYSVTQDAGCATVRVSTDLHVFHCLFAATVTLTCPDGRELEAANAGSPEFALGGAAPGSVLSVVVRLNDNATLSHVRLQHTVTAEASASHADVEVVRTSFPLGDGRAWLERDPPPQRDGATEPERKRRR